MNTLLILVFLTVVIPWGIIAARRNGYSRLTTVLFATEIGLFLVIVLVAKSLSANLNLQVYSLVAAMLLLMFIVLRTTRTRS